jgi:hypothetical protein
MVEEWVLARKYLGELARIEIATNSVVGHVSIILKVMTIDPRINKCLLTTAMLIVQHSSR